MNDALIALGMGGPDSVEAIKPFLYNLFSDREIINFHIGPLQTPIAKIIASSRSKKIAPEYIKMGYNGASPQNIYTKKLLNKVSIEYENRTKRKLSALAGMCYYHPYIKDTANEIKKGNFDRLIILPLYPHYSSVTTGACFSKLNKHLSILSNIAKEIKIVTEWYHNENFCNCIVNRIKNSAESINKNVKDCFILFSAHSLPKWVDDNGDPYTKQISINAEKISKMCGGLNYKISYQSKVGPVKWVGPSTIDTLNNLANNNINNIIVVPIAFVSDHIETLIELDEQLIPTIKEKGINITRAKSLNDDEDFVSAITDIIIQ